MEAKAGVKPASLSYRSAFADYQRWREPDPVSWRAANDEAAAIGGPMGQMRDRSTGDTQMPSPSMAPAGAAATPMGLGQHQGHSMGGQGAPSSTSPGSTKPPAERSK